MQSQAQAIVRQRRRRYTGSQKLRGSEAQYSVAAGVNRRSRLDYGPPPSGTHTSTVGTVFLKSPNVGFRTAFPKFPTSSLILSRPIHYPYT